MGDLAEDTEPIASGDGRYRTRLRGDWEIWGPMGGYVAACALRAAGAAGAHPLPVAFSCHYLGVARFGDVDITVTTRRAGRSATSQRVEIAQDERPILDAMVWSAAPGEGLEHDETVPPLVPGPDDLDIIDWEAIEQQRRPPFPFWDNFDAKPVEWEEKWPPDGPRPAIWQSWLRFLPTATYDDPWIDACRSVILVDLPSWPSASRPHAWQAPPFTAPSLDLNVAFHQPATGEQWLLCDGAAPLSKGGTFGWNARLWSAAGGLVSSGGGQCLYRRVQS